MAIISVLILIAAVFFKDYETEAKMAQMQYDNKVVEGIVEKYLTTHETLPDNLEDVSVLEAYARGKLVGSMGLIMEFNGDSTYKDVTSLNEVEEANSKLSGKFAANNDGDVYYIHNETLEDEIPPIIIIDEYDKSPTNEDVTICATANEGILNQDCYTFTMNREFTFIAVDDSNNKTEKTVTVDFIDKDAPIITLLPYETGPTNQNIEVAAIIADGFFIGPSSHIFTENNSFTFNGSDAVGNMSSETITITNIDKIPPEAPIFNISIEKGTSTVTITYSGDSVVKQYKIDSGSWTNYETPIILTSDATLHAKGLDAAGNESIIESTNVVVDTDPPTITFTNNGNATPMQTQSTSVNITDGETGVDETSLRYAWSTSLTPPETGWSSFANGATLSQLTGTGIYYLHIEASDTIGNATRVTSDGFYIDNTAPIITIESYDTSPTNQSIIVIASTNEGTLNTTSRTFAINGSYTFTVTDAAGNKTDRTVTITNIDKTLPMISFGTNGSTTPKKSHSTTVNVSDNVSVSSRQYAWSTSTATPTSGWANFTNGATITRNTGTGNYRLHIKAVDSVGNVRNSYSNVFNVDNTAPVITINNYSKTQTYDSITVTASASGGTLDKSSHTFTSNGSFMFTARDSAGNIANRSVTVSNIVKLNSFVRLLTRYRYEPYGSMDVIFTKDNHYITVGDSQHAAYGHSNNGGFDGIMRKYDANGNLKYSKNFGNSRNEYFRSVIEAVNGDLILVGYIDRSTSDEIAWIIRTDSNGNLIKSAQLDGSDEEDFRGVAQLNDGNFVAIGETNSIDGDFSGINPDTYSRSMTIKYDNNLNVVWKKIIEDEDIDINSITADSDGGYLVTGRVNGSFSRSRSYIAKFNKDGIEQWDYLQTEYDRNSYEDVVQSGTNYIAVGFNTYNEREDRERTRIATFDTNGNLINEKVISDRRVRLDRISLMPDGGYVLVGGYDGDGMIQKYSSNGTLLHQKIFDPYIHASVRDVVATPDGGYAIVGEVSSDGLAIIDPEFIGHHLPYNQKGSFIIKYTKDGNFN